LAARKKQNAGRPDKRIGPAGIVSSSGLQIAQPGAGCLFLEAACIINAKHYAPGKALSASSFYFWFGGMKFFPREAIIERRRSWCKK